MNKWLVVFCILLFSQFSEAQNYHDLILSLNTPMLYKNSAPIKRIGMEVGYLFNHRLNDNVGIETGLTIDMYGRFDNTETGYDWINQKMITYSNPFWRIGLNIPLLLSFRIAKFEIQNGLCVGVKYLITFSKYPIVGNSPSEIYLHDLGRFFELFYQGNISYQLNERFSPFLEIKCPIYVIYPKYNGAYYSLFEMGLRYNISRK